MTQLRDLIYGYESGSTIAPAEFTIENTDYWLPQNGGCCYLWTVPAGKSRMVFEMWSGGASGGASCCCMQGKGGHAGGYAKYTVPITPGESISFCAGGTGCGPTNNICGHCGCLSTACSNTNNWCACQAGGYCMDRNICFLGIQCYSCCATCMCCGGLQYNNGGGQLCLLHESHGNSTTHQASQFCYDYSHQYMGGSYGNPSNQRPQGTATCCQSCHGGICGSYSSCCGAACYQSAHKPGGGGMTAWTHGGECRCGVPGAGGMIYVVYW